MRTADSSQLTAKESRAHGKRTEGAGEADGLGLIFRGKEKGAGEVDGLGLIFRGQNKPRAREKKIS